MPTRGVAVFSRALCTRPACSEAIQQRPLVCIRSQRSTRTPPSPEPLLQVVQEPTNGSAAPNLLRGVRAAVPKPNLLGQSVDIESETGRGECKQRIDMGRASRTRRAVRSTTIVP